MTALISDVVTFYQQRKPTAIYNIIYIYIYIYINI